MSIPTPSDQNGHDEQRTVALVEAENRYVLLLDGARVGSTSYVDYGDHRVFVNTEIDMDQSGKGLASTLAAGALLDARERGRRIVAICTFTAAYLRGDRDFDDIVDPVTPRLKADLRAANLL
jgi:predicted GNAT family acetyltransferase